MKRELSKDEKIQLGAKIFCGVLCVSLVGGTMAYYKMEEMKAQKQVAYEIENGLNGYEPIEETKNEVLESLLAKPLDEAQLTQIDKNVINNNSGVQPGYDKYGNKYTFSDNGMGAPIEIPDKAISVTNPNTNVRWAYSSMGWNISTKEKRQAEIDRQQNRVVGQMTNITEEEAKEFVKNMTINMGSMK